MSQIQAEQERDMARMKVDAEAAIARAYETGAINKQELEEICWLAGLNIADEVSNG